MAGFRGCGFWVRGYLRIVIPANLAECAPCDLALVIALTLACTHFVLTLWLNEILVWVLFGLLLVLFLPILAHCYIVSEKGRSGRYRADRAQVSGLGYRCCAADRVFYSITLRTGSGWCRCLSGCPCSRSCLLWLSCVWWGLVSEGWWWSMY